ncbi:hypothetical protein [Pseudoduganella chitinolytica]|uniref:Uncharacterized protein n=1 Tax=Pseudoduganella chitinolytica TaxID=34070 RepID=A0ABY8B8V4_9BURK|nr:hypothetical protein [Pseudoduganella chitinolytica]WEF31473.1 hypothetical protein PX653_18670 [Pseudoduganella chitinolytica]
MDSRTCASNFLYRRLCGRLQWTISMRLRYTDQFLLGSWTGLAIAAAIYTRGVEASVHALLAGAGSTMLLIAVRTAATSRPSLQGVPRAAAVLVAALLLFGVAVLAERLYTVHGRGYPARLASETLGDINDRDVAALRETACAGAPMALMNRPHGVVLRCGTWWYQPSTRTFLAASYRPGG